MQEAIGGLAPVDRMLWRRMLCARAHVRRAPQSARPELVAIARRSEHLQHDERLDEVAFRSRPFRLRQMLSADDLLVTRNKHQSLLRSASENEREAKANERRTLMLTSRGRVSGTW